MISVLLFKCITGLFCLLFNATRISESMWRQHKKWNDRVTLNSSGLQFNIFTCKSDARAKIYKWYTKHDNCKNWWPILHTNESFSNQLQASQNKLPNLKRTSTNATVKIMAHCEKMQLYILFMSWCIMGTPVL